MDGPHCFYLLVDGHLGCFHLEAIMINAAMNILLKVFFLSSPEDIFFIAFGERGRRGGERETLM